MTNTSRTIKWLKEKGYKVAIVERYISYGKFGIRKDMFGFGDLVAIKNNEIVAIQSCGQAFAAHDRKILIETASEALVWLCAGGKLWLIGWRKVKMKRGSKRMIWSPRIKKYTKRDFTERK